MDAPVVKSLPAIRPFPCEEELHARLCKHFPLPLRRTNYFDEALAAAWHDRDRFASTRLPLDEFIRQHAADQFLRFLNDITEIVLDLLARTSASGIDRSLAAHETSVAVCLSTRPFDPARGISVRAWIRGYARRILNRLRWDAACGAETSARARWRRQSRQGARRAADPATRGATCQPPWLWFNLTVRKTNRAAACQMADRRGNKG
jgi:hypothetical protein